MIIFYDSFNPVDWLYRAPFLILFCVFMGWIGKSSIGSWKSGAAMGVAILFIASLVSDGWVFLSLTYSRIRDGYFAALEGEDYFFYSTIFTIIDCTILWLCAQVIKHAITQREKASQKA
jgi:hypothetical protein